MSEITNSVKYVGVNDRKLDLFESQFVVPEGMAYNSYVVFGEKIAVMDSVEAKFGGEWLGNIKNALGGRTPDFLVVQHMEPDHSANIDTFMKAYPKAKIVSSAKAFDMMKNFYGNDYADRRIAVKEGDILPLGGRSLHFISAPMVHWPEVTVTYDDKDKILFSADAFGKFGALDADEDWACEARRYYFGIVGKYGAQVQALLKKLSAFEISAICPLHGPVLKENLSYYLGLYNTWSSYGTESEGVVINYTSVYGHTKEAAEYLAEKLTEKGCPKVALNDLCRCDTAEAVEDTFRYGKAVFATTTYNMDIFPFMRTFIDHLTERNFKNKTVAIIENGSWVPNAAKVIKGMLEKSQNITYAGETVTIKSALTDENREQLNALADILCK
ncbi:MAG: FprA family A-type flavoprotein [Clostridia bacterium]|nr:FprA family A-type flavoprotein [Clostridia bacterium]